MADWVVEYTAALDARDAIEGANRSYIDAYTKLADRTAALETQQVAKALVVDAVTHSSAANTPRSATSGIETQPEVARLRADLAAAQRERTSLTLQSAQLSQSLSSQAARADALESRFQLLAQQNRLIERKLGDRSQELIGKARLVEEVQDELAGLTLQLNMAEEKADKLRVENAELVRRWMERMGVEADKMNNDSKWN